MMHYYAQHTATRDWQAPLLGIEELAKAQEGGICVSIGMWVIHDIGFGAWSTEIGVIVGTAMHKAAHQATTGRGRKG